MIYAVIVLFILLFGVVHFKVMGLIHGKKK